MSELRHGPQPANSAESVGEAESLMIAGAQQGAQAEVFRLSSCFETPPLTRAALKVSMGSEGRKLKYL
jgi:hypothetical protein